MHAAYEWHEVEKTLDDRGVSCALRTPSSSDVIAPLYESGTSVLMKENPHLLDTLLACVSYHAGSLMGF